MPSNQDCYNGLINDFREKCHEWQEREIDAVFNKELCGKNIDEVKYIVVADNPGENEKKYSTYLYEGDEGNRSGRIARQIFSLIFKDSPYLVLNKTPIYTQETEDLKKKDESILKETMEYMASLIFKINQINKDIQVYIFGLGNSFDSENECLRNNAIGKYFFGEINKLYDNAGLKIPIIAKHFSHYSLFQDFMMEDHKINVCQKMKFRDLCDANAANFLEAMESLPYRNWMKKHRKG